MIDGALIWLACELGEVHEGGDHVIATGPVLELEARDGEPLLFHEGEYRAWPTGRRGAGPANPPSSRPAARAGR